ncbi:MAG: LysM peptidoglycan-binding domain-containing protein [bacterium]
MCRLLFLLTLLSAGWSPLALGLAQEAGDYHQVRRGENLTVIARRYAVTVSELVTWNELRSDQIFPGQRLRIEQTTGDWYVVRRGDTLSGIAHRFDISLALLKRLNDISGSRIVPGQRLKVRPTSRDEAVHLVQSGETLSEIAQHHGMSLARRKSVNGLSSDRIYAGQLLRLREASRGVHIVERGDALWEIARAYGLSVATLKEINGLTSDKIHPGQELRLQADMTSRLSGYTVRGGDNLTEIARLFQMSLPELRELNDLQGSLIHPGQKLRVRPILGPGDQPGGLLTQEGIDWRSLWVEVAGVKKLTSENGPYYYATPTATRQQGKSYFEDTKLSPLSSYHRARTLWDKFEATVSSMGRLSNRLDGWHIVLDPGHGGIDPGAIVTGQDSEGNSIYVVEDEYVYDLALRVYVLLRLHGADVTLTLLSPNHLIRQNSPVSHTFVHERNEVFNSQSWNRKNNPTAWPKGGQAYLDARVDVAKSAFGSVSQQRRVFLSFHADYDPRSPNAVTLFYYRSSRHTDTASRDFAKKMLPAMGAGARIRGRAFGVLRNNPARIKLLVEMRNLAFADHIWAMRYEQLRQRDAEKVVKALLDNLP